jgi:hypothetical protein
MYPPAQRNVALQPEQWRATQNKYEPLARAPQKKPDDLSHPAFLAVVFAAFTNNTL